MKKTLFLFLLFASFYLFAQKTTVKREKGFQFNAQSFAAIVGNKSEDDTVREEYIMHMRESRLYGVNFEVNYRFDEYLIVGLGTGYEYINQPETSYIPVYITA